MSDPSFKVEVMTLADTIEVAWLVDKLYQSEFGKEFSLEEKAELIRALITTAMIRDRVVLIAVKTKKGHRRILGFLSFMIKKDNIKGHLFATEAKMFVREEHRGTSVAPALIKEAEAVIQASGAIEAYFTTFHPEVFEKKYGYERYQFVMRKQFKE